MLDTNSQKILRSEIKKKKKVVSLKITTCMIFDNYKEIKLDLIPI